MGSTVSLASASRKRSASRDPSKMFPVAFNYYAKAQSTFTPPLIANENAYLGDIYSR